jgi:D-3-phosphoglycerate dehydrogenase
MSDFKYTVYRIGVHARDLLDPERVELERVGARQVVLPRIDDQEELIEKAGDADGLIIVDSPVTRRVMEAIPGLKVVLRTGVGVDVIDVDAATDLGIAVVCVPDLWIREVANHAMAMLLACNRRLFLLDSSVRSGDWLPIIPPPVGSVHGETLGIVGLGRIGRALSSRAAAFELDVIAYDPYLPPEAFSDAGVESVSFDELLRRSDYISLHSPKTDETAHLLDEDALRRMKPTAYLINTSRGPLVDQAALVRALSEGWIAGAALDVLEKEPPESSEPLLKMKNVILTPHSSYYSDAAIEQLPVRCGQEVALVLTGRMPKNLFNPEVLDKLPLKAD